MSLIVAIVDVVPPNTNQCEFAYCHWNVLDKSFSVECPFIIKKFQATYEKVYAECCPSCPLVTAEQYEERLALIPAENRSVTQRVKIMRGVQ